MAAPVAIVGIGRTCVKPADFVEAAARFAICDSVTAVFPFHGKVAVKRDLAAAVGIHAESIASVAGSRNVGIAVDFHGVRVAHLIRSRAVSGHMDAFRTVAALGVQIELPCIDYQFFTSGLNGGI